jgi:hypothetical protein
MANIANFRALSEYKSSYKRQILSVVPTQKHNLRNLHWAALLFSDDCCDNGSREGSDVQAGLIDAMMYQWHMDGSLVVPYFRYWTFVLLEMVGNPWEAEWRDRLYGVCYEYN